MKNKNKLHLFLIAIIVGVFALSLVNVFALTKIIKLQIGSKKALINDKEYTLDAAPFIKNNRTMVPLRFISEAFGAKVLWNAQKREVEIAYKDKVILITIEKTEVIIKDLKNKKEEKKYLDAPAVIVNSRTFVPVRFISESFGATVEWNSLSQVITITLSE